METQDQSQGRDRGIPAHRRGDPRCIANVISYTTVQARRRHEERALHSLSQGSARLVREGLDKDLQVDVYVTHGLPKHEVFIQDLTDLMNEYERASNGPIGSKPVPSPEPKAGMFHYSIIEPKTDERTRAKAKEAGLQEAAVRRGQQDRQGPGPIIGKRLHGDRVQVRQREGADPDPLARAVAGLRVLDHQQDPRDPRPGGRQEPEVRRRHRQGRDQAHGVQPHRRAGPPRRGPEHEGHHRAGAAVL